MNLASLLTQCKLVNCFSEFCREHGIFKNEKEPNANDSRSDFC